MNGALVILTKKKDCHGYIYIYIYIYDPHSATGQIF